MVHTYPEARQSICLEPALELSCAFSRYAAAKRYEV